jgi:methylmalonyl-CoA mutase cobalamin-binding subunit
MNSFVGNAWLRGDMSIAEEHLYTEQVQNVIRHAIQLQVAGTHPPRILLTTFPDEEHGLGLLMVEALSTTEGAQCISLGPRIPLADIAKYAQDGNFDVVAVSFSAAYPSRDLVRDLTHFRSILPEHLTIWVGGAGVYRRRIDLPNVKVHADITGVPELVAAWRLSHEH